MFKKTIMLAAATGLMLSTAAFADGSNATQTDANKSAQTKQTGSQMKAAPAGTTGAATTTPDPRDSNTGPKAKDKTRADDAKQKQ